MPRNQMIAHLRTRWVDDWNPSGYIGPVAGFPGKIDDALATFTDEREKLVASGHLTPAGVQETLKQNAARSIVPLLRKARGELIAARTAVAEKQRQLTAPEIDKGDVVGAMVRREIREHLRSLPDTERMALLLQSKDPRITAAFLELPAVVPVPSEVAERVQAARLDALHGPERRQLQAAEEAFGIVESIVATGFATVRQELGYGDEKAFDAFVEAA